MACGVGLNVLRASGRVRVAQEPTVVAAQLLQHGHELEGGHRAGQLVATPAERGNEESFAICHGTIICIGRYPGVTGA